MIDLHCHILPNMDDGAHNFQDSVNLARMARDNGIGIIVATPHCIDHNDLDDFIFERDTQIENLNSTLDELNIDVNVLGGAEVYLDKRIYTSPALDELTINKSRYLLCEFTLKPFEPEDAVEYVEEILSRGHIPIIAHPERYVTFFDFPEIVNELSDLGCYFQVNASSLAGHGGKPMQNFSTELIQRGFVDFLATDAHSPVSRNNNIQERMKSFPDCISDEQLDWMLHSAPMRVIKNKEIEFDSRDYF